MRKPNPEPVPLKTISLGSHPRLNEKWLHEVIADDPSIVGLGDDVMLKDSERRVGPGRLDLLLQDEDGRRYEVEVQLGATDPSHIIRMLEYWDAEKRKYPQHEHTAVIIAEDITSRFLNVISLFNGFIPVVAIQVSAVETADGIGLHFTTILDAMNLGYDEEDEFEPTDRPYWEGRGTKETVGRADKILGIVKEFALTAEHNYTKAYMGFLVDGRPCNFAKCHPQKSALRLDIKLPLEETTTSTLSAEFSSCKYDKRTGRYKISIDKDIAEKRDVLAAFLKKAHDLHART